MDEQQYARRGKSAGSVGAIVPLTEAPLRNPLAHGWPRAEYAAPLVPSWVILAIALTVAALAGHPWQGAPATSHIFYRLQAARAPRNSICGPDWQVRKLGPNEYDLYTVGAGHAAPCTLPLTGGLPEIYVHASDQGAVLSDRLIGRQEVPIAAGPWWNVPINPEGDMLAVRPAMAGVELSLAVRTPHP